MTIGQWRALVKGNFSACAGSYTRIIPAGNCVGDNAKVAILEIVGYEYKEKEKKEKAGGRP